MEKCYVNFSKPLKFSVLTNIQLTYMKHIWNKLVRTKMPLKEGTKIEMQRKRFVRNYHNSQDSEGFLSRLDSMSFPRDLKKTRDGRTEPLIEMLGRV